MSGAPDRDEEERELAEPRVLERVRLLPELRVAVGAEDERERLPATLGSCVAETSFTESGRARDRWIRNVLPTSGT